MRKVAATLKDSVIPLFVDELLPKYDLSKFYKFNISDRELTNKVNGSKIVFRGMDDPEKIKSIQGLTRIWLEEASEFDELDFDQLNIRIRGAENLQICLTFNPIDEMHWLKKRFFDRRDEDVTVLHTTYKDNNFIDKAYVKEIEKYRLTDYNFYKVYALGEWGKLNKGGEFYKNFTPEKHIRDYSYNEDLPLHISLDENVNPYLTLTIWQVKGKLAYQIDEICLESPRNTLRDTTSEFINRYRNHRAGLFIYGDRTSKREDTKLEKGENFFTLVSKYLAQFKPSLRLPSKNPPVAMRGNFINEIFAFNTEGIELYFSSRCKNTIQDYQYLKEASDGTKLKEKEKNSRTGVVFEKYGHTSDANDYFICEVFKHEFNYFISGARKPVFKVGDNYYNESKRW